MVEAAKDTDPVLARHVAELEWTPLRGSRREGNRRVIGAVYERRADPEQGWRACTVWEHDKDRQRGQASGHVEPRCNAAIIPRRAKRQRWQADRTDPMCERSARHRYRRVDP